MKAAIDVRDILLTLGCGAILYGTGQWSRPAAWVLGGCVLLIFAVGPLLFRRRRD